MKKINLVLLATLIATVSFSQTANLKKRPSLGVSFSMKDFTTPALIRATSFSDVLNNKKWTSTGPFFIIYIFLQSLRQKLLLRDHHIE